MDKKILHLTLHRRWFDQIAHGIKLVEYREVKDYWKVRVEGRDYDEIHFKNGYAKNAPFMRVEYLGWDFGVWEEKRVYALKLGKVLEIKNWNK